MTLRNIELQFFFQKKKSYFYISKDDLILTVMKWNIYFSLKWCWFNQSISEESIFVYNWYYQLFSYRILKK